MPETPPCGFPEIHNHYHFHHHEAPSAELLDKVDALTSEIAALRSEVTAMRIGEFALANAINVLEDNMSIDLSAVQAAVAENTSVDQSAIALINGLADKVDELAAELAQEPAVQAALNDLASTLRGSSGDLSTAVTDNTPAAPPVEEPPAEPPVEEPPAEPVA